MKYKLNAEEKQILRDFEAGNFKSVPNLGKRKKELQESARYTLALLKKNKNVNIRLSEQDVQKLKGKAVEAGLPYQTLIGAILHQYAAGKLKVEL